MTAAEETGATPPELALFSDFDGTLVDIAATPDAITVPLDTRALLAAAVRDLDGAFAVVTGRAIADLERHIGPLEVAVAGSHGAELRFADGTALGVGEAALAGASAVTAALEPLLAAHPGLLLESKPGAVALHYRLAPELAEPCRAAMHAALLLAPGFTMLQGKMVLEARPRAVGKGVAIRAFMAEPPFAGRHPIFIGDDTTDEDGFAVVQEMGGIGIKVGAGPTGARLRVQNVAAARTTIRQLAEEAARRRSSESQEVTRP
jgi:trehalose 6-phosphate phosphatase